jgi:predicted  nucleic acid-binding Zn-ribbon protein
LTLVHSHQTHEEIAAIQNHVRSNTENITHLVELETVSKSQILDLNQTLEAVKLEFSHIPTDLSSKLSNISRVTDKLETDVSKLISLSSADEYHRLEKSSDVVSQDVVVTTSSPSNRVVRSSALEKKKPVSR